jgi:predicted  nucleic acid-binding Zn-ribbon protein
MSVTAKLLRLYRVDGQLRGLQTRLQGAERFLAEQTKQLEQIETKRASIESQLKQLGASAADQEGETARLDAKMETIREQMGSAQTNKEYKAFLSELNTFKAERDKFESGALEQMTKSDELKKQLAELESQSTERRKVSQKAAQDRDERAAEIKVRLAELQTERTRLAAEVPASALSKFEGLVRARGDGAMAPVEIQDRRRHEFTCGGCMMSLPVEAVSGLLSRGDLTLCPACGCVLFLEEETTQAMQPAQSKR